MYLTEELQKKWAPVLEHEGLESIKDPYKKAVTALVLENQQREMAAAHSQLNETAQSAAPTNVTGSGISNYDPILISGLVNKFKQYIKEDKNARKAFGID